MLTSGAQDRIAAPLPWNASRKPQRRREVPRRRKPVGQTWLGRNGQTLSHHPSCLLCCDARVYGLKTTDMHEITTTSPLFIVVGSRQLLQATHGETATRVPGASFHGGDFTAPLFIVVSSRQPRRRRGNAGACSLVCRMLNPPLLPPTPTWLSCWGAGGQEGDPRRNGRASPRPLVLCGRLGGQPN